MASSSKTRAPRKPVGQTALDARSQKAWKAVRQFTSMIPTFTAFARMITHDSGVVVRLGEQGAQTDGRTIWIAPPIALGEERIHDRPYCQKRGDNLRQRCAACDAREVTLFYLYHEIAHIAEKSTVKPRPQLIDSMSSLVDEWHPEGVCPHGPLLKYELTIKARVDYINLAAVHNSFLPIILNALEDARVNARMFRARPGLRVLFEAGINRVFDTGIELPSGEVQTWSTNPLNSQVIIGLFLIASGHSIQEHYFSEVAQEFLRDEKLVALSKRAVLTQNAHQIMELSIDAYRRLDELGLCNVPKCVPAPPAPPSLPHEKDDDEEKDGEQAQDDPDESGEESGEESGDSRSEESGDSESGNAGSPSGDDSGDDGEDSDSTDTGDAEPEPSGDPGESGSSDDTGDSASPTGSATGAAEDQQAPSDKPPADSSGDSDADEDARKGGGREDDEDGTEEEEAESPSSGVPSDQEDQDADDEAAAESEQRDGSSGVRDGGDPEDHPDVEGDTDSSPEGDDPERKEAGSDDVVEEGSSTDGADGEAEKDDPAGDPADDEYLEDEDWDWRSDEGEDDSERDRPDEPDLDDEEQAADESVWDDPTRPENAGTAEQVAELVKSFGGHTEDETVDHTHFGVEEEHGDHSHGGALTPAEMAADVQAITTAIKQSAVFDRSSQYLQGLEVLQYPQPALKWLAPRWLDLKDYVIRPEVIEPAVMKARLVFEANRRGKNEHNLKSGHVNPAVLGKRAPVGDPRIFSRKTQPGKRSYFAVIGVDVSGSTDQAQRNPRIKRAVFAQANLLSRIGVPFAIYGMTGNVDLENPYNPYWGENCPASVWMMEVKSPTEPWNVETQTRLAALKPVAYNFDGHNLEFLRKVCDRQTETDKVILYYTDGDMPASNAEEETVLLQTELLECKKRRYEVLGVGINTDSPRQYGLDTVQVDGDEDIIKVVNQLKSRLVRR